MTAHVTRCALLALLMLGCTESHAPAPGASCTLEPDGGSACPEGMVCALASHATGAHTCRVLCDPGVSERRRRCDTGEVCMHAFEPPPAARPYTCWTGGPLAEGEDCANNFQCGRGLWCAQDLSTADEHLSRCEPVCNDDSHCTAAGERCISSAYCAPPCDPAAPATCPVESICVNGYCLWTRRAADCGRDGTLDCRLGEICSALADEQVCYAPTEYPHPFWP